jgi:glycosyltransferase involved in cell wall biosynthesis
VHAHGGKTFLDAGNSHIENFWENISEEHRRWNCPLPPFSPFWYERARRMLPEVDYVLSPSSFVSRSFLDRGFKTDRILPNLYPVDLSLFRPSASARAKGRPLTIINTGSLSLRKGSPYLLEAFRIVRRQEPSARLLLTRSIREDMEPILSRYRDLPVEWAPGLPHQQLAERLRQADVFVLLSIEEGLVRSALEAMACGLQAVLTPNTGANDFVQPGINGEVVPIRSPQAAAEAILKCWERIQTGVAPVAANLQEKLSFETFANGFLTQLRGLGLIRRANA